MYASLIQVDVLTLFPGMFEGPLTESILGRAANRTREGVRLIDVRLHDLRQWGVGSYKQVDDRPYGGGAGMVMRADAVVSAIEAVMKGDKSDRGRKSDKGVWKIFLTPRGKRLTQAKVEQLAEKKRLLLLCGHYEGVDQRVIDGGWIDEEISIGEYVLTGGELPAMVLIDAVARHIPGVLGKDASAAEESFSQSLGRKKEYPHYTRPEKFRGLPVPKELLSGHHAKIREWREKQMY